MPSQGASVIRCAYSYNAINRLIYNSNITFSENQAESRSCDNWGHTESYCSAA